jgi:hypothetical protein
LGKEKISWIISHFEIEPATATRSSSSYIVIGGNIGLSGDRIIPKFLPGFSDQEGEGKQIADNRWRMYCC